jgi:hypothetical protein
MGPNLARAALPLICSLLLACNGAGEHGMDAATAAVEGDGAVPGVERPALCERAGDDRVRDVFCIEEPPAIGSLEELLALLDLTPNNDIAAPASSDMPSGLDPSVDVTVLGHSTALSGRLVSPLNPRLVLLGGDVFATFQRGVQQVELATRDRSDGRLVLYLLTFEQACNREGGCSAGALYTPAVERDWLRIELEDDEQLKNTPSDCRQCHQRGSDTAQLLMRELESPWTHFFFPAEIQSSHPSENGSALMLDYQAAKGDERYGGLDLSKISPLGAFNMQSIVGAAQPLLFDAPRIENERWPWTMESGYATTVQVSATWEAGYEAFKRGEQLALPYVELRATDPDKQAELSQAYQRFRDGELTADELPDLGDIFPDDPRVRARIGLATEPDATPEEALIQACGPCHNDVLDQSISRARFNIALGRLTRAQIELAIARIELPPSTAGVMPPPEARQLAPEARRKLLDYLRSDLDPEAIDPMLERAATLGMSGGGITREPAGVQPIGP